jgi:hypothetical protein
MFLSCSCHALAMMILPWSCHVLAMLLPCCSWHALAARAMLLPRMGSTYAVAAANTFPIRAPCGARQQQPSDADPSWATHTPTNNTNTHTHTHTSKIMARACQ